MKIFSRDCSYKELVEKTEKANNKQRRFQLKNIAEAMYPAEFNVFDFAIYRYKFCSYKELVKKYNERRISVERAAVKIQARTRKEFKEKDFIRLKVEKRVSYEEYLRRFNLMVGKEKVSRLETVIYGNYKYMAKNKYPETFKESDWVGRR